MKNETLSKTAESHIYLVRKQRVMLDCDLARLYGVRTKELNKAVKRNAARFPKDFAFRLAQDEARNLRFQSGTSSWGGRRYLPFVFTEQGVAMLSSVLKSRRAIQVNVEIMRAFVRLRRLLVSNKELARRLDELERRHEGKFQVVFDAIRDLIGAEERSKPRIGFKPG